MSRQNYYKLLELDYNVDDYDKIKQTIKMKQAEWSKLRNHPSKSNEALAKLEALKGIDEVMSDPDERRQEAEQARKLDMEERAAKEREMYASLDASIAIAAKKGWIEEAEVQSMADLFSLSLEVVKSRITIPIENRPVKRQKKKMKKVNTSKAKEIAENCEKLGIESAHVSGVPSLYDYLQMAPTSSTDVLLQAADERYQLIAQSKRSAENNMETNLQAFSRSIFQNEREQYDQALAQLRLQKMEDYLLVAGATKVIQPAVMEQLKKEAMSLGDLSEAEAESYIADLCRKHQIEPAQETQNSSGQTVKRCHFCGLINQASHHHCTKCQTNLEINCPKCNYKANSDDKVCGNCGFLLGNMANVPHQLVRAKRAIRQDQFAQGKQLLQGILDWWPNHPEAQAELHRMEAHEKRNQEKFSKMKELINQHHYYTARSFFIEERQLVQSSLSLQSMEKESLEHIHLAENYLKQAEHAQDEDAKAGYYLKAIEVAADCEKAKRMLAKWPPSPPSSLQISSESTKISLKWRPSSAKGPIVYRLLRKKGEVSKHFKDGEILQESSDCSFIDYTAVGGYPYYYSIYAIRGSIVSKSCMNQGPFIRRAEVENIEIVQENNQIELKWIKPPGASAIEVWRKEGEIPQKRQDGELVQEVTHSGVVDKDVVFGKTYGYLIVVIYEADGKKFYSDGLTRKSKMVPLPNMLQNITVTRREDGIMLDWEAWEETEDRFHIYYAYSPFTVQKEEPIPIDELPAFGQEIEVTEGQHHAFLPANMKKPIYLLPVTKNDEIALIGHMIISKNHPEVRNIRHWIDQNDIVVQWDWPKDINEVVIVCGEDTFSKDPKNSTGKTTRVLSKGSYDALNGYKITAEERDYYFTIFTRYEDAGELVHSNGVEYLCMNSKQVNMMYHLKVNNNIFFKRIQLEITCDIPITMPDLVLVKKEKSIPTKKEQGEEIYRIRSQKLDGTERFEIPFEHFEIDAYAKLFFEDGQEAQKIRLQAENGKDSMRLW